MGNFIYAVIILGLILVFTGVNSYIICSICDNIDLLLEQGNTQKACQMWESNRKYISLFVRDAEIDVVNTEVLKLNRNLPNEDGEAENAKIGFKEALAEVRNSESINWLCIF